MSALERLLQHWETTEGLPHGLRLAAKAVRAALDEDSLNDEAPTQKMPPVRDTVLRRPPSLEVRELRGSELLHALGAELEKLEQEGQDL